MSDLISREALKKAIEQGEGFSWDNHGKDDLCVRKKYIDNAPTVEAYPFEQVQELVNLNQQFAKEIEDLKRPQGRCRYETGGEQMTLEEAIKHCEEKAEEKRKDYEQACAYNIPSEGCLECAREHEQLAEWLKELRKLKKCRECPLVKEECSLAKEECSICGFKKGGAE